MDLFGRQSRALLEIERAKTELLELRIDVLKEDIDRLKAHTQELAARPIPERSTTPLYMSESEEDIRFMKETQQISIAEAEDMLRQLQFDNETILIDDGDLSLI